MKFSYQFSVSKNVHRSPRYRPSSGLGRTPLVCQRFIQCNIFSDGCTPSYTVFLLIEAQGLQNFDTPYPPGLLPRNPRHFIIAVVQCPHPRCDSKSLANRERTIFALNFPEKYFCVIYIKLILWPGAQNALQCVWDIRRRLTHVGWIGQST